MIRQDYVGMLYVPQVPRVPIEKRSVPIQQDFAFVKWFSPAWQSIHLVRRPEPSSRRLRFPFGRRSDVSPLAGWVVTPKQMQVEPDRELWDKPHPGTHFGFSTNAVRKYDEDGKLVAVYSVASIDTGHRINPRQGWAPDGTVIA